MLLFRCSHKLLWTLTKYRSKFASCSNSLTAGIENESDVMSKPNGLENTTLGIRYLTHKKLGGSGTDKSSSSPSVVCDALGVPVE
jgi:hypothetical protein